ncbi:MAG: pilus assembly protein [Betaproteobacteria bacterium]|jgi:type IV pilus assembly protein PilY1
MRSRLNSRQLQAAIPALAMLGAALGAHAAATDIASGPLGQPATSVKPNVLLILDDSGSMSLQYTPDNIPSCLSSRDLGFAAVPPVNPLSCLSFEPPSRSAQLNTQYYNPRIRYFPAVNYDGSSKGEMNAAATSNWTAVPTDNVSTTTDNSGRVGPNWNSWVNVSTFNLASGFPDQVYCTSPTADVNDTSVCKSNSSYTYPNVEFGFRAEVSGTPKLKLGAPYYYEILATEFCTNISLTNCVSAQAPTVVGGVTYDVPAPVRYCDSVNLTNCRARYDSTFRFPKYLGNVTSAPTPGASARGTLVVTQGDAGPITINQITITRPGSTVPVNLLGTPLTLAATNSDGNIFTAGTAIRDRINANFGGHGYVALSVVYNGAAKTATVTIATPAVSADDNGSVINVIAPATTPTTPASISFNIGSADNAADKVNSIGIGPGGGPVTSLVTGTITCGSGCTNNSMATLVRSRINDNTATHGYTASGINNTVTITAPAGTGSERNGWPLVFSQSGLSAVTGSLANGITPGDLAHTKVNFSGGISPSGTAWSRQNVGLFVRTDIVPGQDFPRHPGRTDCASPTVCTYSEEMTNFANWFAYYRTRMHMAKTAIGRAFVPLGSDYRVGFKVINHTAARFLAVNDFTTNAGGQKQSFFTQLYNTPPSGGTPLPSALSRAGRYYGNKQPDGMPASPIQLACQPSYAILTTDGIWGAGGAFQLDGSTLVGDQDGVNSGFSTRAVGAFDALQVGNTLADVAMYYYKTDLRTDLANQVPSTQKDSASHQRMVTFTVGMGVSGLLTYDPNYEAQTSGDFFDIKQGTKNWPSPFTSSEAKVDDLWHAAVNGRGTYFSAQDPSTLANGLAETLNAVQARLGAGAAAATSNLQPVAGDNFAFTAQYETVNWTGDLKARTIDLSNGIVSTRELWSAQTLLNSRSHTTRKIYTFDAADTVIGATVTVNGVARAQNANRLRSFCPPDTPSAENPACSDGGLLSASEISTHFNPLGGANGALLQSVPWSVDGSNRHLVATGATLVNYLRGDRTNELSSFTASGLTDLYRERTAVLGDIVNAQPAYMKVPPFQYGDPFYGDFKSNNAARIGTVFAAANDGMLHAFETDPDNNPYFQTAGIGTPVTSDDTFTGTLNTSPINGEGAERWAYIPTLVFPTLKRLAESNYATNHRFLTDGSPVLGDVCFGHTTAVPCSSVSNWKTILVAGLNAGGRGFYALDVTDPANPRGLWELKGGTGTTCLNDTQANSGTFGEDCNIGLSFGNPIIVKRPSDGRWVVLLTSGYNNISPGNGKGYLYVVDAQTGMILQRLGTGAGCDGVSATAPCSAGTVDPSGLSRINAWVNDASENNTALSVYGGDLKGNLWRFQLENTTGVAANTVTRITTLVDSVGQAQPLTTRPELSMIANSRIVYVGTGKLLGNSDRINAARQSVYAIKDPMTNSTSPVYTAIRGATGFVQQTLSLIDGETDRRTTTNNSVNLSNDNGWYVDLPDGGGSDPSERVNVDPVLQLGTLVVPSNIPAEEDCLAGGFGWINFMDARSGSFVPGVSQNLSGTRIGSSLVVGINVVQLPGGSVRTIVTTAENQQLTQETPAAATTTQGRRVSWRELFVD